MTRDKPSCIESFAHFGTGLSGIAALVLAIAAIMAALKADDVVKEVLKVQAQAEQIKTAVVLLGEQVKSISASRAVEEAQTPKGEPITDPEKIDEVLRRYPIHPMPTDGGPNVYLPPDQREAVRNAWIRETNPHQREEILKRHLSITGGH
jgi:hypothetical protein